MITPVRISPAVRTGPPFGGEVSVHSPEGRHGRDTRQPLDVEVVQRPPTEDHYERRARRVTGAAAR
ncbi:hypothetical protein ACIF6L_12970 [Kitasatospora sp. NPDC086009]|uniref:hypothetical protein n=1 Tax=unclassified Kitasatospora TaxID=2633591 RepID=UPI0037C5171F